ncbi:CDP-alcohol phosphatidyltransferase family protein [Candidatus Woesearchaeota archaeon]|jgi:1L-myo-inositol 1-phosphate cytidylyltransferase / CDP-L-myo-inositol myo-inositolphosphotransferase|nr:CDP-alcohol phosphatidyltransferase family protein [Candidatus Woesearchaeota archaeon]
MDDINKEKYQKNGIIGVLTRKFISTKISSLLAKTRLTPNQITLFSLIIGLIGIYFLSTGERTNLIVAGILIFFSKIFDAVDGELARLKRMETPRGAWIDGISDRFKENLIFLGVAIALYRQTGDVYVWLYAFIAVISIHMLSIVLEHTGMMDKNALKNTQEDFWMVRFAKKIGIRPQFLALQADTYLFIIYVSIILNQLMFILWFFMVVMNLYWIVIVILVFIKKGEEEK